MSANSSKRRWLLPMVALLLTATVWAVATYPKVGQVTFAAGAAVEARLFGLTKQAVNIGDMELVTYQGGPADAETIVMVHGYTADKDVWPRFAKHFTDDYRVVIPDLAGHGETAFDPNWDYSIPAQTRRVAKLMDALNIDKAHVIGNSMGGHIVGQFAVSYPNRTLSVAPIDPAGVPSVQPSNMDRMRAESPDNNPFFIESRDDFSAFYPMTMAQPPWLPGFVLDAMAEQYMARLDSYRQIFTAIHSSPRLTPDLGKIEAPALLVWGDQDQLIHVSATEGWVAGVPQLQLEVMPGIGHMPMVEAPKALATRYQTFLQAIPRQ